MSKRKYVLLRSLGSAACLLGCLAMLAPAQAQQTEAPPQASAPASQPEYEVALAQALAAHAQGNYEAARIFMERAHQLEPSARTLRGLGIVAFSQGQHLSAIRYFDGALTSQVKALTPELKKSVEELLGHAWSQVARYEVQIDPSTGDYLIDGQKPDFYAANTLVLVPGPHRLTVRAPARESYDMELIAKPGARETLRVVLAVTPAPKIIEKIVRVPAPREVATRAAQPSWWTPPLRYTSYGVGTALVLAGGATWIAGYIKLEQIADACRNTVDKACTSKQAQRRFNAQHIDTFAVASVVGLAAGGAVLLTAATLDVWQRRQRDRKLSAGITPNAAWLGGTF